MNDITQMVAAVESSEAFVEFRSQNPGHYLVHFFCYEKGEGAPRELGYYGEETDAITVFTIDPLGIRPPEPALKEAGALQPLVLEQIKVGFEQARERVHAVHDERYPAHPVSQVIWILQQAEVPVWNVTLVTQTLNLHMLQLDAISGDVRSSELRNILDLRAKTE